MCKLFRVQGKGVYKFLESGMGVLYWYIGLLKRGSGGIEGLG